MAKSPLTTSIESDISSQMDDLVEALGPPKNLVIEYAPLWSASGRGPRSIDLYRLSTQCFGVIVVAIGLCLVTHRQRTQQEINNGAAPKDDPTGGG